MTKMALKVVLYWAYSFGWIKWIWPHQKHANPIAVLFHWAEGMKLICGSVGKDFVMHVWVRVLTEVKTNFPHQLWLLLSDYRGMVKWFGANYNQEGRFSWAVKCKKRPQVLTSQTKTKLLSSGLELKNRPRVSSTQPTQALRKFSLYL